MTSRERVRAVLEHRLPDRIPNGLGGCETAGMHIVSYDRLQRIMGCADTPVRLDTFMTNAVFEEKLINAMDGDIILLDSPRMCASRLRNGDPSEWKEEILFGKRFSVPKSEIFVTKSDGTVVWESKGGAICPKGGYYFDHAEATNLTAELYIPDPDKYSPPSSLPEKILRHLEETAKRIYEESGLSICLGETVHDLQVAPGGSVNTMLLMLEEPDVMHEMLEKSTAAGISQLKELDQAVGKYVDILSIAHDFGDNRGVTIGDELWRSIYKPHYKKFFGAWKKTTSMKINLHSCGAVSTILEDLIECGVDIFNPVQTSACGMSPKALKERFGDRIIFFGGAYDAQLLPHTLSYDEVFSAVSNNLKIFGNGGGYFFAGVHNLPADMPEHHIKAMMDAYFANRSY